MFEMGCAYIEHLRNVGECIVWLSAGAVLGEVLLRSPLQEQTLDHVKVAPHYRDFGLGAYVYCVPRLTQPFINRFFTTRKWNSLGGTSRNEGFCFRRFVALLEKLLEAFLQHHAFLFGVLHLITKRKVCFCPLMFVGWLFGC